MGRLYVPRNFLDPTKVPMVPVEIDTTHPQAAGLTFLVIPGSPNWLRNIAYGNSIGLPVSGALPPAVMTPGTGSIMGGAAGPGLFTYALADAATAPFASSTATYTGTIIWFGALVSQTIAGTGLPWLFGWDNAADTTRPKLIYRDSTYYRSVTQNSTYQVISTTSTAGVSAMAATNYVQNYQVQHFDGAVTTAPSPTTSMSFGGSELLYLGGGSNAITYAGFIYSVGLPGSYSTTPNMLWLYKEPFAMLRPIVRQRWYLPSSGGPTILVPPTAGWNVLGNVPTMRGLFSAPAVDWNFLGAPSSNKSLSSPPTAPLSWLGNASQNVQKFSAPSAPVPWLGNAPGLLAKLTPATALWRWIGNSTNPGTLGKALNRRIGQMLNRTVRVDEDQIGD